jgi:hypothetical protein
VTRCLISKTWNFAASDDELLETMVVENGCSDSGMWYVDTSGCGMLQANDAEPPPRRGWLRNAIQCAAVFLLGLMLLTGTASCNKDPQPTPEPIPTDTVTPVNPGDTIPDIPGNDTIVPPVPPIDTIQPDTIVPGPGGDTIVPGPGGDTITPATGKIANFYYEGGDNYPALDSIRRYADDPSYDSIYINWMACTDYTWTPIGFRATAKKFKELFNISPKVVGRRLVMPYQILPDCDSTNISVKGMIRSDSTQYANWHYDIYPVVNNKGIKNVQPPRYNGNRVLKAGRSR